jgi:hypothetical protein
VAREWVLFRAWRAGGLTLVAVLHAGVLIGTYTLVLAGARRGGGMTAAVGSSAAATPCA